jgi:lipoate-protein ligase A
MTPLSVAGPIDALRVMPVSPQTIQAWWDPPADGPTNMALDEALAAEAARRAAVLVRISTWSRPSLSLGAFQAVADARACAGLDGLPVVRRPSGGGAIIHGSDITLCVAVPRDHPSAVAPQILYDVVHGALVEELRSRGVPASLSAGRGPEGAATDPGAGQAAQSIDPFLCFDRRAVGDVVLPRKAESIAAKGLGRDWKILGSAQRRLRGAVLQHGTLLLGANRSIPPRFSHPGLDDVVGPPGTWRLPQAEGLVRAWLARLSARLGVDLLEAEGMFAPGPGSGFEEALERFRQESWTARR